MLSHTIDYPALVQSMLKRGACTKPARAITGEHYAKMKQAKYKAKYRAKHHQLLAAYRAGLLVDFEGKQITRSEIKAIERARRLTPRPGEVRMRDFVAQETERLKTNPGTIQMRIFWGKYPGIVIRKPNRSISFVSFPNANP